jgi:hypothetical protein
LISYKSPLEKFILTVKRTYVKDYNGF